MDSDNVINDVVCIGKGNVAHAQVNIHKIFNELYIDKDKKIALYHNHPSSNLKNSKCDVMVTKRILKILEKVDLEFIDHFIVSRDGINTFSTKKNYNKPNIVDEKNNYIRLSKSKWKKKETELER